jgi:NAD(P)-dependent dehydrogenase (short-subunit alcohol dehydrogenase family)
MTTLCGQVGLVTGATSGVGRDIALALAQDGAELILVGRDQSALQALAAEAEALSGRRARGYRTDLSVEEDVAALDAALAQDGNRLDVLVHGAGVIATGATEALPVAELDRQYRTNVRGPYLLTQLMLPRLRATRGQIVFLNSTAAMRVPPPLSGQYAATKQALRALADAVRDEVNADGVRVTTVYLGRTATPMQAALHEAAGKPYQPERLIQPRDVAALVLYLLKLPDTAEVTDVVVRPMKKPAVA